MIYKKWTINKSIFEVLRFLFAEINDSALLECKELTDKIIHLIELQTNSNVEHVKYKIWLTSKIILKVYTDGSFDKLDNFIEFIKANMKTAKIETPYCIGGQCWNLQVSYEEEDNDNKYSQFQIDADFNIKNIIFLNYI
jgi:hypothetical protein